MIIRRVVYAPEAEVDLLMLYDDVADAASSLVAMRYLNRLEAWLAQTNAPTSPVATGEGDHEVVEGALPPHDELR